MSSVVGNGSTICAGLLVLLYRSQNLTLVDLRIKLGPYRRSQIAERDQEGKQSKIGDR